MKLRNYQQDAVAKALSLMRKGGGFGLWLEQRTGKTSTALAIVKEIQPDHVWVLVPKLGGATEKVWRREWAVWADQYPGIFHKVTLRIENYEQTVIHRKARYAEARQLGNLLIICDESHNLKRRGTARSRVVRHLGRFARWRLALTGTPIAQGIQDAWAQFDFIDPSIFGTWDDQFSEDNPMFPSHVGFDARYLVWGGYKEHDIVGYTNEKEFYQKFHQHSYRITLREARVKRLLLKRVKVPVALSNTSQRIYNDLKKLLVAEVDKKKIKVRNVLACLIKLQQVTGGSVLVDGQARGTATVIGREKIDALHKIVRSLRSRAKFIVVARFRHEIERIRSELHRNNYRVEVVQGGQPYTGKFRGDCIVLQEQSGMAVDMSEADDIIYYSMDYSYINLEQSRFRALNYEKPYACYHFILATNTVDELIYDAVSRKTNVARLVCDHYRNRGE